MLFSCRSSIGFLSATAPNPAGPGVVAEWTTDYAEHGCNVNPDGLECCPRDGIHRDLRRRPARGRDVRRPFSSADEEEVRHERDQDAERP